MTEPIKLPPLPEKSYLGDDVSYGYESLDMEEYARAAIEADRQARGEPVMLATYYAVADGKYIQRDVLTNQLEIYETRQDAVAAAPNHFDVIPISVTATSGPLYEAPQPPQIPEDFIDSLAQEIRRVDGNHSLGTGALAEALMPFLSRAILETAPELKEKP